MVKMFFQVRKILASGNWGERLPIQEISLYPVLILYLNNLYWLNHHYQSFPETVPQTKQTFNLTKFSHRCSFLVAQSRCGIWKKLTYHHIRTGQFRLPGCLIKKGVFPYFNSTDAKGHFPFPVRKQQLDWLVLLLVP